MISDENLPIDSEVKNEEKYKNKTVVLFVGSPGGMGWWWIAWGVVPAVGSSLIFYGCSTII